MYINVFSQISNIKHLKKKMKLHIFNTDKIFEN